jgi:hypothetical protein
MHRASLYRMDGPSPFERLSEAVATDTPSGLPSALSHFYLG